MVLFKALGNIEGGLCIMISLLDQLFIYEIGISEMRKYAMEQFEKRCEELANA